MWWFSVSGVNVHVCVQPQSLTADEAVRSEGTTVQSLDAERASWAGRSGNVKLLQGYTVAEFHLPAEVPFGIYISQGYFCAPGSLSSQPSDTISCFMSADCLSR